MFIEQKSEPGRKRSAATQNLREKVQYERQEASGDPKSSITCCRRDSNGYCWPSLGLGKPARAEILEGDVWEALKIEHYVLPP